MFRKIAKSLGIKYLLLEVLFLSALIVLSAVLISFSYTIFEAPIKIAKISDPDYIVYSPSSSLIFTGAIPSGVYTFLENASSMKLSPEICVLASINDEVVLARGVILPSFLNMTKLQVIQGSLNLSQSNAIVGYELAEKLNIRPGQTITLFSLISNKSLTFKVSAVVKGEVISDEVIVGLEDARFLRGFGGDYISFVRVLPESNQDMELLSSLGNMKEGREGTINIPAWLLSLVRNSQLSTSLSGYSTKLSKNMESVERASLFSALLASLLLSAAAVYSASGAIINAQMPRITLLWRLGLPRREVTRAIIAMKIVEALASSLLGTVAFFILHSFGLFRLTFLFHSLQADINLGYAMLYEILLILTLLFSVWKKVKSNAYEED
ncbi:MAG: ABC transporter permease [Fervidicoccaceae archaeon]